jgi:hypothetical protein
VSHKNHFHSVSPTCSNDSATVINAASTACSMLSYAEVYEILLIDLVIVFVSVDESF